MIDQPCLYSIPSKKQAHCQPVTNFTYWPVLGSYNNWNIIHLSPKSTSFETFEEIHPVVPDRISDNLASSFQSDKYGAINTADTTPNGYYVIKFISEAYSLQKNTTIDGKIISVGELVVKAQYLCSTKENTNWYWEQQWSRRSRHLSVLPDALQQSGRIPTHVPAGTWRLGLQ